MKQVEDNHNVQCTINENNNHSFLSLNLDIPDI